MQTRKQTEWGSTHYRVPKTASGSNISTRTVHWELHEMCFHGRAVPYTMPSVSWKVKHTTTGHWILK